MAERPTPTTRQESSGGPPPQLPRDPGQPLFPGCRLPTLDMVPDHAAKVGYTCTRIQQLQSHYCKTLDMWSAALKAHKDEAIALQGEEVYNRYDRYLSGGAKAFHDGYLDCAQYTLEK
ncbi:class I SAM-dependent methyltransferase [Mycobacterium sp.]|uniref:class I SAM-dependent methyltransferase n=1 Tax=Mycobacterium sp. TaxID=1785 RepID=UPI003F9B5311